MEFPTADFYMAVNSLPALTYWKILWNIFGLKASAFHISSNFIRDFTSADDQPTDMTLAEAVEQQWTFMRTVWSPTQVRMNEMKWMNWN